MNFEELFELIKNNDDCNFFAYAASIHQANSIDATIAYLESKGIKVNGYVLMVPHGTTGKVVTADKFVNSNPNIKYFDYDNSSGNCSLLKKIMAKFVFMYKNLLDNNNNYTNFYVAVRNLHYDWIYRLKKIIPKRNLYFIILEDGVGSYADYFDNSLLFIQRTFDNIYSLRYYYTYLRFCLGYFFEFINKKIIEKKRNLIRSTIFIKKLENDRVKLVRNKSMSRFYQDVFKKFGSKIPYEKLKIFDNCVLINTQPLNSNNVTDGIIDFEVYQKTVDILKNLGFSVVIKPHPRELDYKKYEKLDCLVFDDNTYTQESILANVVSKPKCIISIYSSTLLNAKGIFNIPAISLAKIMLKEKIDNMFKKQLEDFIDRYKDLFFFPDTYEEMYDYLKMLKNKR